MTVAGGQLSVVRKALVLSASLLLGASLFAQYPATFQITKDGTSVMIEDYAAVPPSSLMRDAPYPAPLDPRGQVARVNGLTSEPSGAPRSGSRFFVVDQNGVIYILDKTTKTLTPYIDVGRTFPRFTNTGSLGMGVAPVTFDPAYATNGRFYTSHNEKPGATGAINPPVGPTSYESVLMEWIDTNIGNATFEGTSRELLRIRHELSAAPDR
jgi:hypothetical protein